MVDDAWWRRNPDDNADEGEGRDWSREPVGPPSASDDRERARPTSATPEQRTRQSRLSASKFLGRFAQLDPLTLGDAVHRWRAAMARDNGGWFAAERAMAAAVRTSGRSAEQHVLLGQMAEVFQRHARLAAAPEPASGAGASEASLQYIATVVMLALLVRDHLEPPAFELLYHPFSDLIPIDELGRE